MTTGKKKSSHLQRGARKSKTQSMRASRKQTRSKPEEQNKPGPGRPKGSSIQPSGLTPNQESIAHQILDAELDNGLFPVSVAQLGRITRTDPKYLRRLLKRDDFQKYMTEILKTEGVVLEGAFWRGMALGLQIGDAKVLHLYASMTGKIKSEKSQAKLTIEIKSPDGMEALPRYSIDSDGDIVDAEVVEDD